VSRYERKRSGIVEEIAGLAERIAELAAALRRLEKIVGLSFAVMDMAYGRGFEDGRNHRPLRRGSTRRKDHRGSHLGPVP
jgi:hypothetical protein